MTDREVLKQKFLTQHSLNNLVSEPIVSDASFRNYERLIAPGRSYILMDSPPDKEPIKPFIAVANFLSGHNMSVPQIIFSDVKNGFLLLEDFGDQSYTKALLNNPDHELEERMYESAIDLLVALHKLPAPDGILPYYDDEKLLQEASLLTEWYIPLLNGEPLPSKLQEEYEIIWRHLLNYTRFIPESIVHRDYHADNLMWLEDRIGINRVGMLDFQDAVIGSPIYDIVSLLEDARRDVRPELAERMITYYLSKRPDVMRKELLASYAILGAHRNLKIVGFIARKSLRDKNSSYFSLLSRVWGYIEKDLKHPLLMPLKAWLDKVISPQVRKPTKAAEKILA